MIQRAGELAGIRTRPGLGWTVRMCLHARDHRYRARRLGGPVIEPVLSWPAVAASQEQERGSAPRRAANAKGRGNGAPRWPSRAMARKQGA
jgi:hypothetical protein